MTEQFEQDMSELIDSPLTTDFYLLAGRLVRAFADLEDLILRALSARVGVSADQARMLVGTIPLSKLKDLLSYMARATGKDCEADFEPILKAIDGPMKMRNVICHGSYSGSNRRGDMFFLTNKLLSYPGSGESNFEAVGFGIEGLTAAVDKMEHILPLLPEIWRVQSTLQTRKERNWKEHPKAPNARQRQKGQKPRRKPSSA